MYFSLEPRSRETKSDSYIGLEVNICLLLSKMGFYVKYIRHLSGSCFQHGYKGNWFYRGTPMQKNPINPAPVLCRVLANSGHLFCQYEDLIDLSG